MAPHKRKDPPLDDSATHQPNNDINKRPRHHMSKANRNQGYKPGPGQPSHSTHSHHHPRWASFHYTQPHLPDKLLQAHTRLHTQLQNLIGPNLLSQFAGPRQPQPLPGQSLADSGNMAPDRAVDDWNGTLVGTDGDHATSNTTLGPNEARQDTKTTTGTYTDSLSHPPTPVSDPASSLPPPALEKFFPLTSILPPKQAITSHRQIELIHTCLEHNYHLDPTLEQGLVDMRKSLAPAPTDTTAPSSTTSRPRPHPNYRTQTLGPAPTSQLRTQSGVPAAQTAIRKFFSQKHRLFTKFDLGILLDTEGWFSVTPEPIAAHTAFRVVGKAVGETVARLEAALDLWRRGEIVGEGEQRALAETGCPSNYQMTDGEVGPKAHDDNEMGASDLDVRDTTPALATSTTSTDPVTLTATPVPSSSPRNTTDTSADAVGTQTDPSTASTTAIETFVQQFLARHCPHHRHHHRHHSDSHFDDRTQHGPDLLANHTHTHIHTHSSTTPSTSLHNPTRAPAYVTTPTYPNLDLGIDIGSANTTTPPAVRVNNEIELQLAQSFLLASPIVIVDLFAGCGGNAIQFALTKPLVHLQVNDQCDDTTDQLSSMTDSLPTPTPPPSMTTITIPLSVHVITAELDPGRALLTQHNARVYGVEQQISIYHGGCFKLIAGLLAVPPELLHISAVFLSPPWGGIKYDQYYDLNASMPLNGTSLFVHARLLSPNIVYFLPKTSSPAQVTMLSAIPDLKRCRGECMGRMARCVDFAVFRSAATSAPVQLGQSVQHDKQQQQQRSQQGGAPRTGVVQQESRGDQLDWVPIHLSLHPRSSAHSSPLRLIGESHPCEALSPIGAAAMVPALALAQVQVHGDDNTPCTSVSAFVSPPAPCQTSPVEPPPITAPSQSPPAAAPTATVPTAPPHCPASTLIQPPDVTSLDCRFGTETLSFGFIRLFLLSLVLFPHCFPDELFRWDKCLYTTGLTARNAAKAAAKTKAQAAAVNAQGAIATATAATATSAGSTAGAAPGSDGDNITAMGTKQPLPQPNEQDQATPQEPQSKRETPDQRPPIDPNDSNDDSPLSSSNLDSSSTLCPLSDDSLPSNPRPHPRVGDSNFVPPELFRRAPHVDQLFLYYPQVNWKALRTSPLFQNAKDATTAATATAGLMASVTSPIPMGPETATAKVTITTPTTQMDLDSDPFWSKLTAQLEKLIFLFTSPLLLPSPRSAPAGGIGQQDTGTTTNDMTDAVDKNNNNNNNNNNNSNNTDGNVNKRHNTVPTGVGTTTFFDILFHTYQRSHSTNLTFLPVLRQVFATHPVFVAQRASAIQETSVQMREEVDNQSFAPSTVSTDKTTPTASQPPSSSTSYLTHPATRALIKLVLTFVPAQDLPNDYYVLFQVDDVQNFAYLARSTALSVAYQYLAMTDPFQLVSDVSFPLWDPQWTWQQWQPQHQQQQHCHEAPPSSPPPPLNPTTSQTELIYRLIAAGTQSTTTSAAVAADTKANIHAPNSSNTNINNNRPLNALPPSPTAAMFARINRLTHLFLSHIHQPQIGIHPTWLPTGLKKYGTPSPMGEPPDCGLTHIHVADWAAWVRQQQPQQLQQQPQGPSPTTPSQTVPSSTTATAAAVITSPKQQQLQPSWTSIVEFEAVCCRSYSKGFNVYF